MDDATKELGRRTIAAGWRWMPGCLVYDGKHRRVIGNEALCEIVPGETRLYCAWPEGSGTAVNDPLPDFSDPATLGCLDAQLAERFGCPVIVTPFGKMFRAWRMLPPDVDEFDYRLCAIRTATTLAGAKVAALEAAPKVAP